MAIADAGLSERTEPVSVWEREQAARATYLVTYRAHVDRVLKPHDYQEAIWAVDPGACNLPGLTRSLGQLTLKIRQEHFPEPWEGQHPILVLMLSQINQLAGGPLTDSDRFADAWTICTERCA